MPSKPQNPARTEPARKSSTVAQHVVRPSGQERLSGDDPLADSRRSLTTGVAERIETMILTGALKPGARINEVHLGNQLKVSRAPIREACRRLERHGLVEMRPNLGAFVCTLDARDIADLYDLRTALEALVGRRAAERIDQIRLARLDALMADLAPLAAAGDSAAYWLANQRFHAVIVEAAGSRHLTDAYDGVTKRLALYRIGRPAPVSDLRTSLGEHRTIVAALRARDPSAAGEALADHCRSGYHRHFGADSADQSADQSRNENP